MKTAGLDGAPAALAMRCRKFRAVDSVYKKTSCLWPVQDHVRKYPWLDENFPANNETGAPASPCIHGPKDIDSGHGNRNKGPPPPSLHALVAQSGAVFKEEKVKRRRIKSGDTPLYDTEPAHKKAKAELRGMEERSDGIATPVPSKEEFEAKTPKPEREHSTEKSDVKPKVDTIVQVLARPAIQHVNKVSGTSEPPTTSDRHSLSESPVSRKPMSRLQDLPGEILNKISSYAVTFVEPLIITTTGELPGLPRF